MGNLLSCTGLSRSLVGDDVVKLVHSNGLVEEFYRAVRVCELSVDYPHHFICSSGDLQQICNGPLRKLSEEESMELGQIYFLLPTKVFELPLTQADVRTLFSKAGVARKACYKELLVDMATQQQQQQQLLQPGHVMLDQRGAVEQEIKPSQQQLQQQQPDAKFSRELIQKLIEETRLKLETQLTQRLPAAAAVVGNPRIAYSGENQGRLPELQTAYARHMLARSCTKLWRPPLETIKEDSLAVS